jgi:putative membrane protein
MSVAAQVVTLLVALLHLWFLVLEMFLWTKPSGRRVFRLSEEQARATRTLAANQGLYNGFLAAGLLWGVALGAGGLPQRLFFLSCAVVAGVFGAATVGRKILFVQALPALVALVLNCAA